jgi:hypothetical protein
MESFQPCHPVKKSDNQVMPMICWIGESGNGRGEQSNIHKRRQQSNSNSSWFEVACLSWLRDCMGTQLHSFSSLFVSSTTTEQTTLLLRNHLLSSIYTALISHVIGNTIKLLDHLLVYWR